jgi:hypothetical protein
VTPRPSAVSGLSAPGAPPGGAPPGVTALPGGAALPLPPGDVSALLAAARRLRAAAGRAGATGSLRGSLRASLPTVWSGAAATAALAEAGTLVSRARAVLDGLVDSAAVVEQYARSLETGQVRVRALQRRWDDAVHERDRGLAVLTLRAGLDPMAAASHAADRARVLDRHEVATAALGREHLRVLDELAARERSAARSLAALDASVLPPSVTPGRAAVEAFLTAGMPVASGAVHGRSVSAVAATDAVAVTDLRERVRRGEDVTADAVVLAALLRARGRDPVYAQGFVEAVGVARLQQLLAELVGLGADGRGGGGLDAWEEVAGAVGPLLLTAVVPASSGGGVNGFDARTARAVDARAALLRDRLVAEMGAVHTVAGGGRHSGYWLFAQALGRSRSAGWDRALPGGLVARLAAATASAERGESRDDDLELIRGTTLSPRGGAWFASLQDDPDRSGDALHVLLAEVDDPASAAQVLTTPVDAQGLTDVLTDARGGDPTLADVLVRRWVTDRNRTAPSADPVTTAPLATDADLVRLTALLPAGSTAAAEVRARVMAELGRTAAFAAGSPDTAARQRAEAGELEATVAGWLTQMRASLDRSVAQPVADAVGGGGGWSTSTEAGVQPSLTVAEVASVVGALALEDPWGPGASEPGAAFVRLVDGELAHLAEVAHAASGETSLQAPEEVARTLSRLGFVDQAGSAALVAAARRRDELDRTSWQTLAEAKNVAASLGNPVAAAMTVKDLVTGGTTRSSLDDLVVELVRSDAELEQTRLAEARRATLLDRVHEVVAGGLVGQPGSAAVLLASGASRAPATATSAAVAQARQRLRTDAATTALWDRLDDRRSKTVRGAVRSTPDAGSAGVVERGARDHRQQKELDTADRLDRAGHDVEFLPASGDGRSADALVDGLAWEFKALTGAGPSTVTDALRRGRKQSPRLVIDLALCPLSLDEVLQQVERTMGRYGDIEVVRILTRDGLIIERRQS